MREFDKLFYRLEKLDRKLDYICTDSITNVQTRIINFLIYCDKLEESEIDDIIEYITLLSKNKWRKKLSDEQRDTYDQFMTCNIENLFTNTYAWQITVQDSVGYLQFLDLGKNSFRLIYNFIQLGKYDCTPINWDEGDTVYELIKLAGRDEEIVKYIRKELASGKGLKLYKAKVIEYKLAK